MARSRRCRGTGRKRERLPSRGRFRFVSPALALRRRAGTLAMSTAFRNTEAQERPLEGGGGRRLELGATMFGQRLLGPLSCLFSSLPIDLLGALGHVGE